MLFTTAKLLSRSFLFIRKSCFRNNFQTWINKNLNFGSTAQLKVWTSSDYLLQLKTVKRHKILRGIHKWRHANLEILWPSPSVTLQNSCVTKRPTPLFAWRHLWTISYSSFAFLSRLKSCRDHVGAADCLDLLQDTEFRFWQKLKKKQK